MLINPTLSRVYFLRKVPISDAFVLLRHQEETDASFQVSVVNLKKEAWSRGKENSKDSGRQTWRKRRGRRENMTKSVRERSSRVSQHRMKGGEKDGCSV